MGRREDLLELFEVSAEIKFNISGGYRSLEISNNVQGISTASHNIRGGSSIGTDDFARDFVIQLKQTERRIY